MEYKNNGIPKETDENDESASNTPLKTPKTISSVIKSLKKVEEVLEPVITSGQILCNCFTCGHPVCAPMSTDNLTKQGSTLDTSSIAAYQQKVRTLSRTYTLRTYTLLRIYTQLRTYSITYLHRPIFNKLAYKLFVFLHFTLTNYIRYECYDFRTTSHFL
jgi:hypothetical protein